MSATSVNEQRADGRCSVRDTKQAQLMTVALAALRLIRGRLYSPLINAQAALTHRDGDLDSKEQRSPSRPSGASTRARACAERHHVVACVQQEVGATSKIDAFKRVASFAPFSR